MNSRNKGKRGELEARDYFRERGYEAAERGQQRMGSSDSPDVVGGPVGFHPEVKRTERFQLYDALDQAIRDARIRVGDGNSKVPFVMHRCNKPRGSAVTCRGEWIAVMLLDDVMALIEEVQLGRKG